MQIRGTHHLDLCVCDESGTKMRIRSLLPTTFKTKTNLPPLHRAYPHVHMPDSQLPVFHLSSIDGYKTTQSPVALQTKLLVPYTM